VLYPSPRNAPRDEVEKTYSNYSVADAQLTNLYLPHKATYVQRMDTTQTDRILLKRGSTGRLITVFDFEGATYRY